MTGSIDQSLIEDELQRVLGSQAFARSVRSRDLLRYLINRHNAQDVDRLKEAIIAIDVFKRSAGSFDGDRDGIVRVSINRLRDHLDRFYKLEADGCRLRFEIPRGSYAPIIRRTTPGGLPDRPRIAVLPLANLTGDTANDPVCDGLTEDLIDTLAQVPQLRVISRTSSFEYKDRSIDLRAVATRLNADALLEGSIQRVGDFLRITAQLILGTDGTHLWSRAFEAPVEDRATIRTDLIDFLQRTLRSDMSSIATSKPTPVDALPEEVREKYYLALYQYRRDTVEGYLAAERTIDELLALSPNAGRALALKAKVCWSLGNSGERPLLDAARAGYAAAKEALRHSPSDMSARCTHIHYTLFGDYDAERALTLARDLRRTHGSVLDVLYIHGKVASFCGCWDEARESYREAANIDPVSLDPLYSLVSVGILSRDYQNALHHCDAILAREPSASIACWNRSHLLRVMGRVDDARRAHHATVSQFPSSAHYNTLMDALFAASEGNRVEATKLRAAALEHVSWKDDVMTYATVDALIGDDEAVYRSWEHSLAERDPYVYYSVWHPEFDRFHSQARFQSLVQTLKLPPSQR